MSGLKSLIKDTALYGMSSIIGRFLNWCLVPLYVYLFPADEYGVVSYLYSFTAVALVILNYGMETGFFRFVNTSATPEKVYSTALRAVASTSLLFMLIASIYVEPLSEALKVAEHADYVWMLVVVVAIDAFANLPFAYLRYKQRPIRFASIKMLNVGLNIALNIFFILLCPWIDDNAPSLISWFYLPLGGEDFGIGWIFVANLISSVVILLMLLPELRGFKHGFDAPLMRRMLRYSWPLLVLGVAGIMSQNMGQMVIPYLFDDAQAARSMVGIYGANIKIAIVMVMFTQAFRYAYEPFIFSRSKGEDKSRAYCDAMKFFVIFGFLIFLGVLYYLPLLKYFIAPAYWEGLRIVPIMMLAELCFGIFFNLSLWYKLTDRTQWGMYFSLFGFVVMFALNIWLVPMIGVPDGYIGSAWAALISYALMMLLSYLIGRRYYPLPYEVKRMALYSLLALLLYVVGVCLIDFQDMMWLTYTLRTLLLLLYVGVVAFKENLPILSPALHRIFRRG